MNDDQPVDLNTIRMKWLAEHEKYIQRIENDCEQLVKTRVDLLDNNFHL